MLDSVYLCIIQIGLLNNHVKNKTSKKSIEQFSSVRRLRTLVHRLPQCEYQMQEKQLCLKVEMAASLECFWSLLLGVRPACSVDVDGRSFDGSSSSDPSSSDVRRSCQQATTIYNTHGLYTITAYNTESKKHATLRLGITLANVDQFS